MNKNNIFKHLTVLIQGTVKLNILLIKDYQQATFKTCLSFKVTFTIFCSNLKNTSYLLSKRTSGNYFLNMSCTKGTG